MPGSAINFPSEHVPHTFVVSQALLVDNTEALRQNYKQEPKGLNLNIKIPYNGNHPQKKKFANFANLEAFVNVFLHFLSRPEFLYNYEIAWIAKVFSRIMAKKVIRETFLPRMIPVIR